MTDLGTAIGFAFLCYGFALGMALLVGVIILVMRRLTKGDTTT